jgi:protein O-mannosyl-transferase
MDARRSRAPLGAGVLLALVTLILYWPARHHEFIVYDDPGYVAENPVVRAGLTWAGVKWAFTTTHASDWQPLTFLSHMLDCQLFGLDSGRHHLVSVLLHTTNSLLLFVLLWRMTAAPWRSIMLAALFAWHPLRVESVAWVAERKGILCALFGLLALIMYARYVELSKVQSPKSKVPYGLALLFFGMGLMAKPVLVTLPLALLLLDYWPLCRISRAGLQVPAQPAETRSPSTLRRFAWEKWPFFVLSAASSVVTFAVMQHSHSLASLQSHPLLFRIENAILSYVNYVLETFWPVNLTLVRLLPAAIPWGEAWAAAALLGSISWLAWRERRSNPCCLAGWLWFLGMLVPVIGIVQQGLQARADRYTYLPQIGLFIAITFAFADWAARRRVNRSIMILAASVVLGGCLLSTGRQLRFWRTSETLFSHALAVTRDNYVAAFNYGIALYQRGQLEEALNCFQDTLKLNPEYAEARNNLAAVLMSRGEFDEAIVQLRKALEIQPDYAEAHCSLGNALLQTGELDEAIRHYQESLQIQPDFAGARNNLGVAFMRSGQLEAAIAQFQEALRIDPGFVPAEGSLRQALAQRAGASKTNAAPAESR